MPYLKTYDLFISHAWKYGDDYTRLVNLLSQANLFTYRNYSAPQDKPLFPPGPSIPKKTVIEKITNKIKPVNAVIVLTGMYAAYRDWIQVEIEVAQSYGKPIIGVVPWGQVCVPLDVQSAFVETVRWNTDSIVGAIRRHAL